MSTLICCRSIKESLEDVIAPAAALMNKHRSATVMWNHSNGSSNLSKLIPNSILMISYLKAIWNLSYGTV